MHISPHFCKGCNFVQVRIQSWFEQDHYIFSSRCKLVQRISISNDTSYLSVHLISEGLRTPITGSWKTRSMHGWRNFWQITWHLRTDEYLWNLPFSIGIENALSSHNMLLQQLWNLVRKNCLVSRSSISPADIFFRMYVRTARVLLQLLKYFHQNMVWQLDSSLATSNWKAPVFLLGR